jgi:ribosomal-protein-alanine N-acetyltransferase
VEQLLKLNLNPFPTLYTDRLILRRITIDDAQDFFAIRSNKELMAALDKEPLKNMDELLGFFEQIESGINSNTSIAWAACLKEDNKMIGHVGYHRIDFVNHRAEIGYALLSQFHNKSLGSEALKVILDVAFNQFNFHSLEADVNPINNSSIKLITKLGFVKEAHFRENYFFRNTFLDSAIYSLLKKDYLRLQSQ